MHVKYTFYDCILLFSNAIYISIEDIDIVKLLKLLKILLFLLYIIIIIFFSFSDAYMLKKELMK